MSLAESLRGAVLSGDVEKALLIIDSEPAAFHGSDLVGVSASRGDGPMTAALLSRGFSPESMAHGVFSALAYSAELGLDECVAALLAGGAQIDRRGRASWTALMRAAWAGEADCCIMLLEAGADTSVADAHGQQALHFAAVRGRTLCAQALLAHGALIDALDADGRSPLMAAAGEPWLEDADRICECSLMLLKSGANASLRDPNGFSALDLATRANGFSSLASQLELAEIKEAAGNPAGLGGRPPRL